MICRSLQEIACLNPPVIDAQLGADLLDQVEALYRRVYPLPKQIELERVLERRLQMPFRNPRRLIRHAIDRLDRKWALPNSG